MPTRATGIRALLFALAMALCMTAHAQGPTLAVQLTVRDGFVVVDPEATTLQFGEQAVAYERCGLSAEAVRGELIAYLDGLLQRRGKAIEQLAVPPLEDPGDTAAATRRAAAAQALRQLAQSDGETGQLYQLQASWGLSANRFAQWMSAQQSRQPPVMLGMRGFDSIYKWFVEDPLLADGPLSLAEPFEPSDPQVLQGRARFTVRPPFTATAAKLHPSTNLQEWAAHRGQMAEALLAPFACRLWYRDRIIGRAQDYFEMRGISVQPFHTKREATNADELSMGACGPQGTAGIAPERPSFARQDLGGRVLLSADPLIDNVYIEADTAQDWPTLRRVLYLLLPSNDNRAVTAAPADYLCRMEAVWKPAGPDGRHPEVVRLGMATGGGKGLALAGTYMTRRAYAERLQRLDGQGFIVNMGLHSCDAPKQRSATSLLIERNGQVVAQPPAQAPAPPLPLCPGAAPAAAATPAPTLATAPTMPADATASPAPQPIANSPQADVAQRPAGDVQRRHQITLGVEHEAGKPLRYSVGFAREGLAKDDTVAVEIGQQVQASGKLQYGRDFLAFEGLQRRVQFTAEAYSDFNPDRAALGSDADERREGADLHATIDLWRDRAGSFGQIDLSASRYAVKPATSQAQAAQSLQKTQVSALELGFFYARAWDGTPGSARLEFGGAIARGQASDPERGFSKTSVDASYRRFVGPFTRWDLRAHARRVGADAPRTEWPAFGGDESVRGYRADAAVAQSTWVLQNEYWLPLSALAGRNEALAHTLRRSAALALFADIGGLAQASALPSGLKAGIGAGLRLALSDAFVLRLDWARAVGPDVAGPAYSGLAGHAGRFYLTVTSNRSL